MSIEYLAEKMIKEGYKGKASVGFLNTLLAKDLHLGAINDEYNVKRAVTSFLKLRGGGAIDLPTALPMTNDNPTKALELKGYGIKVGNKADLFILDTKVKLNAIIDIPERLYVIKNGHISVENHSFFL